MIGDEEAAKGADLVYGPTINIVRVPQWGRAFESLGEDPVLTGAMAAAEVEGVQGTGTMAEVKHYAVYNQETYRNTPADDAVVGQKALHEVYLRAWGEVVGAGAAAVMCSYSTVNGVPACEDRSLIKGYLDTTLGFSGFVGSDYGATGATVASAQAGVDQEQPGASYFGPALALAVSSGLVPKALLDQAVTRVLTEMFRFGLIAKQPPRGNAAAIATTPADQEVSTEVATEAMTLLKDDAGLLPLASHGGPVAVIGAAASYGAIAGGGSATVVGDTGGTSPLLTLRSDLEGKRQVTYTSVPPSDFQPVPASDISPPFEGSTGGSYTATLTAPESGTYLFAFSEPEGTYSPVTLTVNGTALVTNPGTPPVSEYVGSATLSAGKKYTLALSGPAGDLGWVLPSQFSAAIASAVAAARAASVAVVFVADDQESEAADRASLALPAAQDELVSAVAKANARTVVVIEAGGPVTMPWLGEVPAVLDAWYPGQSGAAALAAVLLGRASPSGHLPMSFPASLAASPVAAKARFPGNGTKVEYSEGVDVGYRWYDQTATAPLFPFGYGLSYTTFSFSHPTATVVRGAAGPVLHASVEVADTGRRPGADVVQVYLGEPPSAGEPPRQLEAFERVALGPGQRTTARFALQGMQLGYYSAAKGSWEIAPGRYQVWMGDSSALAQLPAHVGFSLSSGVALGPAGGP